MKNLKLLILLLVTSLTFAQTSIQDVSSAVNTVKNNSKELKSIYQDSKEITSTVYQDGKQATTTVYDDSKELLRIMYEDGKIVSTKLESALLSIAEGLKTTSMKAWDILVRQQLVWSWCYLIVTLSSIFLWYKFGRAYNDLLTDVTPTGEIKNEKILFVIFLGGLALVDSIISGFHFEQMMTGFINPEFGAIRTLFELDKSL